MKKLQWKLERHSRWLIAGVLAAAFAAALIFGWQLRRLEQGALDVCAVQQDAYVQLVLDQINLEEHRENAEIIENILSTLDASTNKYWVFSEGQDMLFVKDVLETNKYKGFTASSYYLSESARTFYDSLQLNHVRHAIIDVDGKEYVASGVAFRYADSAFRLCLLTNRDIILENNAFLRARSEMWVLLLGVLVLLLVVSSALLEHIRSMALSAEADRETIASLNRSLGAMNDRLTNHDLYDNVRNCWELFALHKFLQRIREKGFSVLTIVRVSCETEDAREHFLALARQYLTREVLRFEETETEVILLFVGIDEPAALLNLLPLLQQGTKLDRVRAITSREELEGLVFEENVLKTVFPDEAGERSGTL